MDEFAVGSTSTHSCFGPVRHSIYADLPNDILNNTDFYIPGGSSGGCAVAVATGVADVAIGSDTGGSVRYPAAFNGVYGFKPSYGRLSRYGLVPLANQLDTPAIFSTSVPACRYFYEILKGHDVKDSTTLMCAVDSNRVKRKKIKNAKELIVGIPKYKRSDLLSDDARGAWQDAIDQLVSKGATIKEIVLSYSEYAIYCYSVIVDVEVASNMARYDGIRYGYRIEDENKCSFLELITKNRTAGINMNVKRRIISGNFYALEENYKKYVEQAARVQRLIQNDFKQAFEQVNCILTPVTRNSAQLLSQISQRTREEQRLDDYFVLPANLSGVPAISIPYSTCSKGFPLGVQMIAPYLEDELLLDMAEFLKIKNGSDNYKFFVNNNTNS